MQDAATANAVFEPALNFVETARARTIELVAGLSQEQMDFTPAAGKWSIGEIVDHLLLSERLYRDEFAELIDLAKSGKRAVVTKSVREVNFAPFFLPKSLLPLVELPFSVMTAFVPGAVREFMIRYPFLPGQNPDAARPAMGRPAGTLRQELAESVRQTAALLRTNPDLDYRNMTVRHALLGTNNVVQLLRIVALHEQRHQGQISGVRNSLGFPKAA